MLYVLSELYLSASGSGGLFSGSISVLPKSLTIIYLSSHQVLMPAFSKSADSEVVRHGTVHGVLYCGISLVFTLIQFTALRRGRNTKRASRNTFTNVSLVSNSVIHTRCVETSSR